MRSPNCRRGARPPRTTGPALEAWRSELDERIKQLNRLRDHLTDCIGCGSPVPGHLCPVQPRRRLRRTPHRLPACWWSAATPRPGVTAAPRAVASGAASRTGREVADRRSGHSGPSRRTPPLSCRDPPGLSLGDQLGVDDRPGGRPAGTGCPPGRCGPEDPAGRPVAGPARRRRPRRAAGRGGWPCRARSAGVRGVLRVAGSVSVTSARTRSTFGPSGERRNRAAPSVFDQIPASTPTPRSIKAAATSAPGSCQLTEAGRAGSSSSVLRVARATASGRPRCSSSRRPAPTPAPVRVSPPAWPARRGATTSPARTVSWDGHGHPWLLRITAAATGFGERSPRQRHQLRRVAVATAPFTHLHHSPMVQGATYNTRGPRGSVRAVAEVRHPRHTSGVGQAVISNRPRRASASASGVRTAADQIPQSVQTGPVEGSCPGPLQTRRSPSHTPHPPRFPLQRADQAAQHPLPAVRRDGRGGRRTRRPLNPPRSAGASVVHAARPAQCPW